MRRYTLLLTQDPESGAYTVTVPALPGCITQGPTLEEAKERAREAIALWIEVAQMRGEEIPEDGGPLHVEQVDVAA